MRAAKAVGWLVGGLVALIAVVLIGVKLFVNPNNYKGRIEAAVKQSTGRELELPGNIKLAVFPWIALELGPASLGNPPGFGDQPFLSFQHAAVRVKLLPLLSQKLEVARVELDGFDLRLLKNEKGEGNWSMKEDATAKPAAKEEKKSGAGPELQSIAGIRVQHGRVSYQQMVIENFDLETGSIAAKHDVPVSVSFDANRGIKGEALVFTGKFSFSEDSDTGQYHLAALNLNGTVSRPQDPQPMAWDFAIPALDLNLDKQTLSTPEFSMSLANLKITGKLAGTQIIDDLHLTGAVAMAPLLLKEFVPHFGIALPKTKDPKVLAQLSAGTNFAYNSAGATLDGLQFQLDDTKLKGRVDYLTGKVPTVKFDLAADKIDLDRYTAPEGTTPPPKTAAAEQPSKSAADNSAPMSLQGTFTMDDVKVAALELTNLRATLDSKDNVARLNPTEAQIYGGKYTGDITYDTRKATPAIALDAHLTGIDTAQLIQNTKAKGRLSGKANVNLKIAAQGTGADDITKTADGRFDANLADGAIEGVDLTYELALAQALLAKQTSTSTPNAHRTKFDTFKMSAQITDGVADTKDLSIVSSILKIAGQGTINLPTTGIDMTLLASLLKSGGKTTAVDIPLKITGKYTDPSVKPDMEALAKGAVKQKLQDALKKNGVTGIEDLFKH